MATGGDNARRAQARVRKGEAAKCGAWEQGRRGEGGAAAVSMDNGSYAAWLMGSSECEQWMRRAACS